MATPVSYHLDLYRYWLAKRGNRSMPARSDLDPADLIPLLPHLIISERVDDRFRYRLFGTGVAGSLGYDATGYFAGEYLNTDFRKEIQAVYDTVVALHVPVFARAEFCFPSFGAGALHAWSTLILPLSDDDRTVNKTISSLIARLHPNPSASPDWLAHQPAKVLGVTGVRDAEELEKLCLEWDTGG